MKKATTTMKPTDHYTIISADTHAGGSHAQYREYLDKAADHALDLARQQLPEGVTAELVRHSARSAPSGLVEIATQREASMLLLGSSSAGAFGHVALGSVSDSLLLEPVMASVSPAAVLLPPISVSAPPPIE